MAAGAGRYEGSAIAGNDGWRVERVLPPSRLMGSNGLRAGPDGRLYVAQVAGSQVSAIDVDSGAISSICPIDGPITAPDDLVFDDRGNMYVTEITTDKVSVLTPKGEYRVLNGDMPVANPITWHQGRLIAGECRMGGRLMELDPGTGEARLILGDVPMPNACEVGPDGKLYAPIMAANEIWRIDLETGEKEVIAADLGVPDSVKFDRHGRIVSTQVASGQVLRIDPQTGARELLAQLNPGLDNCAFIGDRLFVSSIPGEVWEIGAEGGPQPLVESGLQWPMGLAVGAEGTLFVADGGFTYTVRPGGSRELLGMLFSPGFPGFTRGVAAAGAGEWVTTNSMGAVMRWNPGEGTSEPVAAGYELLYGVAVAGDGAVVFADGGTGKVWSARGGEAEELASGLKRPMGVAVSGSGEVFVSESEGGRVVRLSGGKAETVLDGLAEPHGIAIASSTLYVVDAESKELVSCDLASSNRRTLASGLPVKAPPGVTPKLLGGVGDMAGPMVPFTGIAVASDGTIYVSGDAEGSVLAVRPA